MKNLSVYLYIFMLASCMNDSIHKANIEMLLSPKFQHQWDSSFQYSVKMAEIHKDTNKGEEKIVHWISPHALFQKQQIQIRAISQLINILGNDYTYDSLFIHEIIESVPSNNYYICFTFNEQDTCHTFSGRVGDKYSLYSKEQALNNNMQYYVTSASTNTIQYRAKDTKYGVYVELCSPLLSSQETKIISSKDGLKIIYCYSEIGL